MSQSEILVHTIKALVESANEYMLTGSLVSSMQGEPRATHDIDFVVYATVSSIEAFLERFPRDEYYYDSQAAKDAVMCGGMFNILSFTGDKVDIWILTNSEFDQSRFLRKQIVELFGLQLYVSSPEDTILMKLLWAKQIGGSEKQLFDAAKVYNLQHGTLDECYIESWADKLNLKEQQEAMKRFL